MARGHKNLPVQSPKSQQMVGINHLQMVVVYGIGFTNISLAILIGYMMYIYIIYT